MSTIEALSKIKNILINIENTSVEIREKIEKVAKAGPVERIGLCADLRQKYFDQASSLSGLADLIDNLDHEIDDGSLPEVKGLAIKECAEDGLIDAEKYNLNGTWPDWKGAIDEIDYQSRMGCVSK